MKQNKKIPPTIWVDKIMILIYHDPNNCDYTIDDLKNQILFSERRETFMVYLHNNLLYGGL